MCQYAKAGSKAAKWTTSLSLSLIRNKPPGVANRKAREESLVKVTVRHGQKRLTYDDSTYTMRRTLNLPITLSEKTASVNRVAEIVSLESFEGKEVFLDSDNLKIPDSAGTRGM